MSPNPPGAAKPRDASRRSFRRMRRALLLLGFLTAPSAAVAQDPPKAPPPPAPGKDAPPPPQPGAPPNAPPNAQPGAPKPANGLVPVETFFRGKVLRVKGREIEIAYDFESAEQLRDFEPSLPFRAIRTIAFEKKGGRLAVSGTGSVRHAAVFSGGITVAASFTPRRPRDFGFAITEHRESEVFTLYCVYDRYFGTGDNVHVPQNMIIKFIPRDPKVNKEGFQDWRYCGSRGQKPEIAVGKTYRVTAGRDGIESSLQIDDWDSKGKEAGRDLSAQRVAVYGYDAEFEIDDLRIAGKLDPEWVAERKLDLASWKPPAPPDGPGAVPPPVPDAVAERFRARVAGYPLETKPPVLASMLRDTTIPAGLRAEAAEKAKTVASKRIVPYLVDGLYSADEEARRLSADVVKSLLGKNFGYKHDGSEDGRKRAIQALNEYLQKHPEEFQ